MKDAGSFALKNQLVPMLVNAGFVKWFRAIIILVCLLKEIETFLKTSCSILYSNSIELIHKFYSAMAS